MCVTAVILAAASLAVSAAGTVMSISSANANASAQQQQLNIQQKQMQAQLEAERLQASEAEAERVDAFRRQRAANLAAMAASGINQNISFLQGIAPAEERALRVDLRNIRLGLLGSESRMADEIRVNRLNSRVVSANKTASTMGSLIGFAGSALQAGQFYSTYKTPSVGGAGGGFASNITVNRGGPIGLGV